MIGLACKRIAGASLLFDMRGLWVDERVEAGLWRSDAPLTRAARELERRLLAGADAVVVLTAQAPALVEAIAGRSLPAVRVIPTCVDLTRFRPTGDDPAVRAALGLRPGPGLVCAGSLSTWYLAERAFAIGAAFRRAGGGSFVVLTRETELADRLDRRFAAGAIVRSVDHDEMPRWLAACSAGLVAVRPGAAKRASAPTKVAEYLACGLAVAATRHVGDLDAQFAVAQAAFTFDPAEPAESVAARLLAIATRPGRQRAARGLAERFYSLDDGVRAYAEAYGALGIEATPSPWLAPAVREAS
jgi:glycosyltransferase involved in cell wall biosynthesis